MKILLALLLALGVEAAAALAAGQPATVVRIIDGDTFIARLGGQSVRIRLRGVDAPELRGKCPRERELALAAKAALAAILPVDSVITLHRLVPEWRGRRAADVLSAAGLDPAAELVAQGHAPPWTSGPRPGWCGVAGALK